MKTLRLFTDHPASVGESYGQHLRTACGFAGAMLLGGVACLVHAVFPFLCVTTGSRTIARLHERMIVDRSRHARCAAPREDNAQDIARRDARDPARSA